MWIISVYPFHASIKQFYRLMAAYFATMIKNTSKLRKHSAHSAISWEILKTITLSQQQAEPQITQKSSKGALNKKDRQHSTLFAPRDITREAIANPFQQARSVEQILFPTNNFLMLGTPTRHHIIRRQRSIRRMRNHIPHG